MDLEIMLQENLEIWYQQRLRTSVLCQKLVSRLLADDTSVISQWIKHLIELTVSEIPRVCTVTEAIKQRI